MSFRAPVVLTTLLFLLVQPLRVDPVHGGAGQDPQEDSEPAEQAPAQLVPGWLNDIRLGGHVVRIRPNGSDAENFSKSSWGGGVELLLVPAFFDNWVAVQFGFEGVVFLSQTHTLVDPDTQLRTELSTSQDLGRLVLGLRLGHQGHGTLRPYVAGSAGINHYRIHSTLTVPDDFNPMNSIKQDLGGTSDTGFGLDGFVGLEVNLLNNVFIDVNVGYMKNYHIKQKISDKAIEISPEYFVVRAGVSASFAFLSRLDGDGESGTKKESP